MMATEWAIEWKTFRDGDYDRMIDHNFTFKRPFTEAEARAEVASMKSSNIPARVIKREVTDWTAE